MTFFEISVLLHSMHSISQMYMRCYCKRSRTLHEVRSEGVSGYCRLRIKERKTNLQKAATERSDWGNWGCSAESKVVVGAVLHV